MISPYVKCVCPSCFEEIFLNECEIVSGRTAGKVLKERSKGTLARIGRVEPLDGPKYTVELAQRVCYNCNYLLPYNIERVRSLTFAVVGDTFSGKSHYIAAFIRQLKDEWINNADNTVQITCLTPDIEKKYEQDYFRPLFVSKQRIELTHLATKTTLEPLIYRMVIAPSAKHPPTTFNLMIYDIAGEDYVNQIRLVQFGRFVLTTDAFIFVADPVMMPEVFYQLPINLRTALQAEFNYGQGQRVSERISSIIGTVQRFRGLPSGSSLPDIPIAVMLSKADLLKHLYPPKSLTLMENPQYGYGLNVNDITIVDREVRDFLITCRQADLLAATNRFKQKSFFATSATGEPPDGTGQFTKVEPCRCLDPVLWILNRLDIIPTSR